MRYLRAVVIDESQSLGCPLDRATKARKNLHPLHPLRLPSSSTPLPYVNKSSPRKPSKLPLDQIEQIFYNRDMKHRKKIQPAVKWNAAIAAWRSQSQSHSRVSNESDKQSPATTQEKKWYRFRKKTININQYHVSYSQQETLINKAVQ